MAYDESRTAASGTQTVTLENRQKLHVGGVSDVNGFDENLIILKTALGSLNIRGEALHIDRIDLDAGQLEVRGKIRELSYDEAEPSSSLWSRLFG